MKPRCYVAMPFGIRTSRDNREIDFDEVYQTLICPAAKQCDFDVVRADEYFSNAPILDTVIQLITGSPLMICDITTNNPNVIYELGIRHSFVPGGALIIRQGNDIPTPFYLSNFSGYFYNYPFPDDSIDDQVYRLSVAIRKIYSDKTSNQVYRKARYAKHFDEYHEALERFYSIAPYEKSVFIMTKFPERNESKRTDNDRRLDHIIDVVKRMVVKCGYTPRIAYEKRYHQFLWKNIEVYLLGCSKGIAIVEDKYSNETNPNVAMEWGWMRAGGKDVLYLLENDFQNERADFSGFLSESFSWEFPDKNIEAAIDGWLSPTVKVAAPEAIAGLKNCRL